MCQFILHTVNHKICPNKNKNISSTEIIFRLHLGSYFLDAQGPLFQVS